MLCNGSRCFLQWLVFPLLLLSTLLMDISLKTNNPCNISTRREKTSEESLECPFRMMDLLWRSLEEMEFSSTQSSSLHESGHWTQHQLGWPFFSLHNLFWLRMRKTKMKWNKINIWKASSVRSNKYKWNPSQALNSKTELQRISSTTKNMKWKNRNWSSKQVSLASLDGDFTSRRMVTFSKKQIKKTESWKNEMSREQT